MRTRLSVWLALSLALLISRTTPQPLNVSRDRQPAVAGQFYPGSSVELRAELRSLFTQAAPARGISNVIAIIAPHAGYVYSGAVAASGFNQIDTKKKYENIFVLGPSHHVGFEGASVYVDGNFVTPLGAVQVNTQLGKKLIEKSRVFSSRTDAHAQEHSVEVEVPFLQYLLGTECRIVPIVIGASSPETCREIADVLRPYFGGKNLFVVSSDFSHYPSYDDAKRADKATADAILTRSPDKLIAAMNGNARSRIPNLATSLCGWPCVLSLLYLIQDNSQVAMQVVDARNSGDADPAQKERVVGYCAIAVSLPAERGKESFNLKDDEKKSLLILARRTIDERVRESRVSELDPVNFPKNLATNCGAFVTLRKNGQLRGCIGRFDASEPLYRVVQQMAIAASTEDYRFTPVAPQEIGQLELEISVLTPMRRIRSIDEFQLGKQGIYMKKGERSGTFLPQVAEETGWSKEEFFGHCAQDKAGIGWDGWKDAELYVYEALVFDEKGLGLR